MNNDIELKRHPETNNIIPEIWKFISGYNKYYAISNYGRAKSWKRNIPGYRENPRLLKTPSHSTGYCRISLTKNKKHKAVKVHRLVAKLFVPNPDNKPQVNHLDGDKENNFFLNLEWCTQTENNRHALRTGLRKPTRGERCNKTLKKKDVLKIRSLYKTGDYRLIDLSDMFGVQEPHISRIINRKRWAHI